MPAFQPPVSPNTVTEPSVAVRAVEITVSWRSVDCGAVGDMRLRRRIEPTSIVSMIDGGSSGACCPQPSRFVIASSTRRDLDFPHTSDVSFENHEGVDRGCGRGTLRGR